MDLANKINRFRDGPRLDVGRLIQDFGIALNPHALLHPEIVGQIEKANDGYRISVQQLDHENRKRFTMAHELGHYLYHRDLLGDGVDDNKMYRSENIGKFYNRQIQQRHETEANKFAASILMPSPLVRQFYQAVPDNVRILAREFGVSPAAMKIRLNTLGLEAFE